MATSEDIDYNRADKATLSNYADVVSEHLHFEWDIDFDAKELSGSVTHSMKMLRDGVGVVELDTSKLTVLSASINGENSSFTVADAYRELGNKLT